MRGRAASWIAWSACGLTLAMIACAVALAVPNRYGLGAVLFILTEASAALVGALIASRRPENPVGWLVSTHALFFVLGEFGRQYAIFGLLTEPGSLPLARVMASPPYWVWFPGLMSIVVFLPLYFPDGRLVSRRWRPVAWLAVLLTAYLTAFALVRPGGDETRGIPNPLGLESPEVYEPLAASFEILAPVSWVVLGILAVASLVVRFWRSRGVERQQIKWVVYAVVLLQEAFRTVTGRESQLAVVASTLTIAALFSPLRSRVQSFIDRRFYRNKYDAATTLAAFNTTLRDETDLGRLSDDLLDVVRETVQPEHASLWLREFDREARP